MNYVTTTTEIARPRFRHAWRADDGTPRAHVDLGEAGTALVFSDQAVARETAAACLAAADAMDALAAQEVPADG